MDMGKGCIRFKKLDEIPYELIGKLAKKINVEQWIQIMENNITAAAKNKKAVAIK